MTLEYLKQIKEKEELAGKIRQDGLLESKRIIDAANDEASALINRAQSEADALYREVIAKAESESRHDYERVIVNAQQECDLFLKEAEKHQSVAVSLILKRVLT